MQYPTPMIIAKIIKPISTGVSNVAKNTTIATITMNAITPMTMAPIVPNVPYSSNDISAINIRISFCHSMFSYAERGRRLISLLFGL
jgi:hypothetical protein